MIQITVEGRRASVSNKELLTSGSAGIEAQFTLDEAWELAPARTAVFRVGDDGNKYDVPLDNSLTCVVPPECLTVSDEVLFIGIYGGNGSGTIIIPTIWVSAGVIKPGTEPNTPREYQPTPSVVEQIHIIANRAEQTATDAMTLVEEGLSDLSALESTVQGNEEQRQQNETQREADFNALMQSARAYVLEPSVSAIVYDPNAESGEKISPAYLSISAYYIDNEGDRGGFVAPNFEVSIIPESGTPTTAFWRNTTGVSLELPQTITPGTTVQARIWKDNSLGLPMTLAEITIPVISDGLNGYSGTDGIVYTLEPSVNAIVYDPNAALGERISPTSLTVNMYEKRGTASRIAKLVSKLTIEINGIAYFDTGVSSFTKELGNLTPNSTVRAFATNDGKRLATITIPIVSHGEQGTQGDPGVSPEVTVTQISGGHTVEIEDADGVKTFDVLDGASDAGRVTYDETATYQAGSVGAELSDLTRHLNELVLVQDTQPTEPDNKIWIPEDGDQTFVVPEYSEFEQVANQLIEPSLLLPLTWAKGEAVNHSTGAVGTNSNGAVTNYYETDEARYIVLQLGEGVTTSRYIQFVTYQSDGTYVTGEQIAFSTVPYKVKTVKPGYKYRFGVTKPTAADIDDVIAMTEFQYTHLLDSEKGFAGKVADLEAKVPEFEHLKHDVNGGGDQISFVLERGTINTTTGEDSSSTVLARSVGYYASDGNGLIISSPVGGTVIPYEYSAEDASGFVGTVGPAGGVTYVNSPCTLPTEAGKYYRFTFNLNNSATWNDPEEFFGDFEFVLANTYQVGLESRVTALEQESGSDKIFTGKVWVALGDSITYRGVDTPQGNPGYRPIVTDVLGFTTYNKGIGSTSLGGANDTAAMCSTTRLNGVLHPDSSDSSVTPDFVTILGGANDLGTSMLIGDETEFAKSLEQKDRDTFIGAYSYIIEYLLGQNPTINIMILGTTWAHSDGVGSEYGKTYTEYSDASRKVAEYYGLPFVDLHGECGFNAFTMGATAANRIYSSDQIHPNQAGSEKIASLVAAKMIAAWKYTI